MRDCYYYVDGIVLSHTIATDEPVASCFLGTSIVSLKNCFFFNILVILLFIIVVGGETGCGSGEAD